MNKEIRKRKRTFLAVCLALVVVLLQLTPVNVLAATYQLSGYNSDQIEPDTDMFQPEDVIKFKHDYGAAGTTTIENAVDCAVAFASATAVTGISRDT